jgi:hypothetical protein
VPCVLCGPCPPSSVRSKPNECSWAPVRPSCLEHQLPCLAGLLLPRDRTKKLMDFAGAGLPVRAKLSLNFSCQMRVGNDQDGDRYETAIEA